MEEDLIYAMQTANAIEKMPITIESVTTTTDTDDLTPENTQSISENVNSTLDEVSTRANNKSPDSDEVRAITPQNVNSDSSSAVLISSEVPMSTSENVSLQDKSTLNDDDDDDDLDDTPNLELEDEIEEQVVVAKRRGRARKNSLTKSEEERKEYNRLRQAKYRANKRQSADTFLEAVVPEKKKPGRRGRKSAPIIDTEEAPPAKKPLILRQKREVKPYERYS